MSNGSLVAEYYNNNFSTEHNRLISGKLEFTITLHTILTALPKSPSSFKIADIGGGTGCYGKSPTLPCPEIYPEPKATKVKKSENEK